MIQARFSVLRNKYFLLLGLLLIVTFVIFKFDQTNSNEQVTKQTLLLKIKKLELQNEAYKQQFEEQQQRLFAERELYERTKKDLNASIRDLKEIHYKENQDASIRFSSLQQQYKILKSSNDDLQQHCEKLKELLEKTQTAKQSFQVKYENILKETEKLEELKNEQVTGNEHQLLLQLKYKNYLLEQDNKDLIKKLQRPLQPHRPASDPAKVVDKSFRQQVPMRNNEELIHNVLIKSSTTTTPTSVVKKENPATTVKTPAAKISVRGKLPRGVLPIPDLKVSSDLKEFSGKRPPAAEPRSLDNFFGKPQSEIEETENRANNAAEDFNIEEKLSKLDDGIVQEGGDKIINNAAEELDGHRIDENKGLGPEENELEVIHRAGNGVKDRLNDEIAGDHGKEAGYPEDLHMIEGQQEENDDLGDVGDYDHDDPRRKLGGVAERN